MKAWRDLIAAENRRVMEHMEHAVDRLEEAIARAQTARLPRQRMGSGQPLAPALDDMTREAAAIHLDSPQYFDNHGNMELTEAVSALGALAQETRLAIFRLLIEAGPEGLSPGSMGEQLEVPPATLSFHLKELSHAGLATSRQEGRFLYYSANFEQMAALMTFLTQNCCRGMPQECLDVVETALGRCCAPGKRKPARSKA